MTIEEIRSELSNIPWFQDLTQEHVAMLAEICHHRTFKAGEVFFQEGDKQDYLYFVLHGRVALNMFVPHHGKTRFYTAEQWDVFGWSSVTPTVGTRTAGAVGVLEGAVLGMDAHKLITICDQNPDLGYQIMKLLNRIVSSRLMVMRLQLLDMFAEPPAEKNLGE